jgi:hypothetical protein
VKKGTTDKILDFTEEVSSVPNASASQVTIEKILPLNSLAPGTYELKMKVTDKISNQTLSPITTFTVI